MVSPARKTSAPQPDPNKEELSLKSGMDVRSLSSNQMIALSRTIGNHALQRLINDAQTPSAKPLQPQIQRSVDIDNLEDDKAMHLYGLLNNQENDWKRDDESFHKLLYWADSIDTVFAVLELNLPPKAFTDLIEATKGQGIMEPLEVKSFLLGKRDAIDRVKSRTPDKVFDFIVEGLVIARTMPDKLQDFIRVTMLKGAQVEIQKRLESIPVGAPERSHLEEAQAEILKLLAEYEIS